MDFVKAFVCGGLICVLTQILMEKTKLMPGRIMVILVTTGVVLGAVGIYEPFVKFAGAGATIPHIVRRMIQRNGWWVTLQGLNSVWFMWKHLIIEIWYLALLSSFPNRNDGRNCLAIIKT